MPRRITLLLFLVLLGFAPAPALAQEGIQIIREEASYLFAQHLSFEIEVSSPLKEAHLIYHIESMVSGRFQRAQIEGGTANVAVPLAPGEIPPAAQISYFWKLEDPQGQTLTTEEKSFLYLDQRFNWQSKVQGEVTLFWYGQDEQFAQSFFVQLNRSFTRIEQELGLVQKEPLKVVAYQSWPDMRPATGVVEPFAIILGEAWGRNHLIFWTAPGWEETLTHELTHLLTHQLMGEPYDDLPFWLSEGLATYAEGGPRQISSHPLPLYTLDAYPDTRWEISLAYAQAQSLVAFLIQEKGGGEKLKLLLATMAKGETLDNALLSVYGFDRQGLERSWREWIGNPLPEEVIVAEPKEEPKEAGKGTRILIFLLIASALGLFFLRLKYQRGKKQL